MCVSVYEYDKDKKKRELQIGFIGFVLWLVHSCRNLCSLLTYANNAQKCLNFTHTSSEKRAVDSAYKLKSYEFELQSIFFCCCCTGWLVCLLHSFRFCLFSSLFAGYCWCDSCSHTHSKCVPYQFQLLFFFLTFQEERKKHLTSLKKLYKQIKLNLF